MPGIESTVPAMKRVIDSILVCAPKHLEHFLIHVVTEEGAEGLPELKVHYRGYKNVEFLIVPKEYQTPRGRAIRRVLTTMHLSIVGQKG